MVPSQSQSTPISKKTTHPVELLFNYFGTQFYHIIITAKILLLKCFPPIQLFSLLFRLGPHWALNLHKTESIQPTLPNLNCYHIMVHSGFKCGQVYKPLKRVRGSYSHRVRPQYRGLKGEDTRNKEDGQIKKLNTGGKYKLQFSHGKIFLLLAF